MNELRSQTPAVRLAAFKTLGAIGGPAAVQPLAEAAAGSKGVEQTAARAALGSLKGRAVDEEIIAQLAKKPVGCRRGRAAAGRRRPADLPRQARRHGGAVFADAAPSARRPSGRFAASARPPTCRRSSTCCWPRERESDRTKQRRPRWRWPEDRQPGRPFERGEVAAWRREASRRARAAHRPAVAHRRSQRAAGPADARGRRRPGGSRRGGSSRRLVADAGRSRGSAEAGARVAESDASAARDRRPRPCRRPRQVSRPAGGGRRPEGGGGAVLEARGAEADPRRR